TGVISGSETVIAIFNRELQNIFNQEIE
ncbi:hypothetical protein ACUOCP_15345, partial [Escherichia sp. R-CC3]